MSSSIQITGLTASSKTPGAVGQMRRARGKSNPDAAAKVLCLLGNKTSAGSLVADAKPVQVFSEEEAIAAGGARGEVTQMALAALAYGIAPFMGAVTEAGGGAAGTWTLTFANGNAGTAGTIYFIVGHPDHGVLSIPINIPAGSTPTASAVIAKTAINTAALGRLPYTADNSSGVLTITSANVGVRANQYIAHLDNTTSPPTTQTSALTGGTALSDGGIPMTGGSGQDTLTAILANMLADQYEYQAIAANDATSVDAALDQIDAKDHPLVGMTEFLVVGLNGTQAAAITFGSSSMNHALGQLVFLKSCMTHPSVIAASMAAKRATTEGTNRN
ncbi:MAG TPA: hypothetical protein VHO25_04595, partial [Polyangiaceae bacterium]|nr:hypothetical protein [Polyangiaceae bacterium]